VSPLDYIDIVSQNMGFVKMAKYTKFRGKKLLKLVIFHNSLRGGSPRSAEKRGGICPLLFQFNRNIKTEQHSPNEIDCHHDAHADPKAENGGTEIFHGKPVPKEHKHPSLQAEGSKDKAGKQYHQKNDGKGSQ